MPLPAEFGDTNALISQLGCDNKKAMDLVCKIVPAHDIVFVIIFVRAFLVRAFQRPLQQFRQYIVDRDVENVALDFEGKAVPASWSLWRDQYKVL